MQGWFVHRRPDGAAWEPGIRPAELTVTGRAAEVLLVLTRRMPLSQVRVDGDAGLARHWLEHTPYVAG